MDAQLAFDVARAADLPTDELPEVAMLGRSNVGKSTLINALLGRRNLARTSGTPGKTRRIHFYRVEGCGYLVDLPGYGYARVARDERSSWRALVEGYLRGERQSLRAALLLVDIRRDWRAEEAQLVDWLQAQDIELRLVLTKADKLARSKVASRAAAIAREAGVGGEAVVAVSAHSGDGLGRLAPWLGETLGVEFRRADGRLWQAP